MILYLGPRTLVKQKSARSTADMFRCSQAIRPCKIQVAVALHCFNHVEHIQRHQYSHIYIRDLGYMRRRQFDARVFELCSMQCPENPLNLLQALIAIINFLMSSSSLPSASI